MTRGEAALLTACALALLGARFQLTAEQALARAFPTATETREHVFEIDPALRDQLRRRLGYTPRQAFAVFHEGRRDGRSLGHAIVMNDVGKTLPITFLVVIAPDARVDQVLLMAFREPRGYEIEREIFRRQYRGRRAADPVRRGRDIRNISGATMSVDAMSRGVKRALVLYQRLVGGDRAAGDGP